MRDYRFDFASATDVEVLQVPCGYLHYYECLAGGTTDAAIFVQSVGGGWNMKLRPGEGTQVPRSESGVVLTNASGAPMSGTVKIAPTDWEFRSNQMAGTLNVVDGGKARTLAGNAFTWAPVLGTSGVIVPNVQLWNGGAKNVFVSRGIISANVAQLMTISLANVTMVAGGGGTANSKRWGTAPTATPRQDATAGAPIVGGCTLGQLHVSAGVPVAIQLAEPIMIPPGYGLNIGLWSPAAQISGLFEFIEE